MSDLQLGLFAIGMAVIAGVYTYNRLQERRFRKKAEQTFERTQDDALLPQTAAAELAVGRVEPQLGRAESTAPGVAESSPGAAPVAEAASASAIDPLIDCVVEVGADQPFSSGDLHRELATLTATWGKPVLIASYDAAGKTWFDTDSGDESCTRLRCALQIANRSGCISAAHAAAFRDCIVYWAQRVGARIDAPDPAEIAANAQALDRFCADVDVAVGVNVVAGEGIVFAGTKLRALAEAAGFRLEPDGVFHFRDTSHATLFTLDNHEPMPFVPEQMKSLQTRGITLLLDVPRVSDAARAFNRMWALGNDFAAALGGVLVDDNRASLSEAGIAKIRAQLQAIREKMETAGIAPGSARALRLFS